jgi:hypothetical protein
VKRDEHPTWLVAAALVCLNRNLRLMDGKYYRTVNMSPLEAMTKLVATDEWASIFWTLIYNE